MKSPTAPSRAVLLRMLQRDVPPNVFNPWVQRDALTDLPAAAAAARLRRLAAHLATEARCVLVGEAAGYQGCKVSGIAFTSERLIIEGGIPRVAVATGTRLSLRPRPWSEPSATTVWKTLHELGIASCTVLWNAYPWHPHRPGEPHSNRAPTRAELQAGLPVLASLLRLFPQARVFAVGRHAGHSLAMLAVDAVVLRHPSMGGAATFARQLREQLRRDSAATGGAAV